MPVSFAAQANLGSLVAQAELGDYQPIEDYANHLNNARVAQPTMEQEQFISHVRELHKHLKLELQGEGGIEGESFSQEISWWKQKNKEQGT